MVGETGSNPSVPLLDNRRVVSFSFKVVVVLQIDTSQAWIKVCSKLKIGDNSGSSEISHSKYSIASCWLPDDQVDFF